MLFRNASSALFILLPILLTGSLAAQNDSLAWKRSKHLSKGVNLSSWLAQSGNYNMPLLRAMITPTDIERIHSLGFDHVRIPVDPVIFNCPNTLDRCDRVQLLDQVIAKAFSEDLDVILTLYPETQYMRQLASGPVGPLRFVDLWGQIAEHYAKSDSNRLFFEIINEAEMPDAYRWSSITERSIEEIRKVAPNSTVIVSGPEWADIWDLIQLPKFKDDNLIYAFHYYEPHLFTQQGADWGNPIWTETKKLPFPVSQEAIAPLIASQEDPTVRWEMLQYSLEHWDADHIAGHIKFAATWGKSLNVPLICDEFGVYRPDVAPEDRERWLRATREALEKNGIGWSVWDYQGGFGVVYKERGVVTDDDNALRGLGLKK